MKSPLFTAAVIAAAAFLPGTPAQELDRVDVEIGRQIAAQGNRALRQIQADTRAAVRHLTPALASEYAAVEIR